MTDGPGAGRSQDTHHLPAGRPSPEALREEIARVTDSPIVTALLRSTAAAAAVVDAQRVIVAYNPAWLALVGDAAPESVLGARPGEVLGCAFPASGPDGCGTCVPCASCGLAAGIVAASRHGDTERSCALKLAAGGSRMLKVRAAPLELEGVRFVVIALTDVTGEQRHAEVERAFTHDLANLAHGLSGVVAELAPGQPPDAEVVSDARMLSAQLLKEIGLHRALVSDDPAGYRPSRVITRAQDLLVRAHAALAHSPAARGRNIRVHPAPVVALPTDPLLVQHVLVNMLLNACEASGEGDEVTLSARLEGGDLLLEVTNPRTVPEAIRARVFQRHFSTKPGTGRGLGTFAMQLFGERMLGGRVDFTTSAAGTTFRLRLPVGSRESGTHT
ncbi:MAG: sensor histidine kinase [Anaeromyxobacter sp.]